MLPECNAYLVNMGKWERSSETRSKNINRNNQQWQNTALIPRYQDIGQNFKLHGPRSEGMDRNVTTLT